MDEEQNSNQHKIIFEKLDEYGDRLIAMESVVSTMNDTLKSNAEVQKELADSNKLMRIALFPNAELNSSGLVKKVESQDTLLKKHSHILKYSGVVIAVLWAVTSNFDKVKLFME